MGGGQRWRRTTVGMMRRRLGWMMDAHYSFTSPLIAVIRRRRAVGSCERGTVLTPAPTQQITVISPSHPLAGMVVVIVEGEGRGKGHPFIVRRRVGLNGGSNGRGKRKAIHFSPFSPPHSRWGGEWTVVGDYQSLPPLPISPTRSRRTAGVRAGLQERERESEIPGTCNSAVTQPPPINQLVASRWEEASRHRCRSDSS